MMRTSPLSHSVALTSACVFVATATVVAQVDQLIDSPAEAVRSLQEQLGVALVRLPLAAALGAALAFRPRRPGTPERSMPVIETQIILSIVGALIMLVIGASLARAFGIVGAANLIRYRAKIDDPKDAVVMLSTLSIGLASGVGLYVLATFGTLFIGVTLWAIEGFEPESRKPFELTVTFKEHARDVRPQIEQVLRRYNVDYELRGSSEDELTYQVMSPPRLRLDRVSNALTKVTDSDDLAVEWDEKKTKKPVG
jgi:hypothetical protein